MTVDSVREFFGARRLWHRHVTRRGRWVLAVALGVTVVAVIVGTWPENALPTFRTPCDPAPVCRHDWSTPDGRPVFADSSTARFVRHVQPFVFWLWFAVSPFGYLTVVGVRWLANRLHEARRAE
jgi:hypothetical protein